MADDCPLHYKLSPEPIEVINGWGLNFNAGCVIKYLARYRYKGDAIADLEKAKHYIEFEIERINRLRELEGDRKLPYPGP